MSGHSHWHGIRHKKALTDAKKASVFTKYGKLIAIAARDGGGNPDTNLKLKFTIAQARAANMPKENIERAIKRGTGELKDGVEIQEIVYEAFGPGRVAMMIQTATDNRNRTFGDIKTLITKAGGQMGQSGTVSFLFQPKGIIRLAKSSIQDVDSLQLAAIDAGAEDIVEEEEEMVILTDPKRLKELENILSKDFPIENSLLGYWPNQKTHLDEKHIDAYRTLWETLSDHEDVQDIFDTL